MRRREVITLLGGATAWPLAARAQQREKVRRVGVFMALTENDPEDRARVEAFRRALAQLDWVDGRNVQIDIRWPTTDSDRFRKSAAELVVLAPDVIVATGDTAGSMQQATQTIPIVFVLISDPVSAGYVANLNRPGGNMTGFTFAEFGISGKWVELLKQIAPGLSHVGVIYDPASPPAVGQLDVIRTAAGSSGIQVLALGVHDADEIDGAITKFARDSSRRGLIMAPTSLTIIHREQISALANRFQLPAVYGFPVTSGLLSYATDTLDQYRQAAGYVDRILKGEKPGDLPVQNPTKFKLILNLKAARALNLTLPQHLLATADEVIE